MGKPRSCRQQCGVGRLVAVTVHWFSSPKPKVYSVLSSPSPKAMRVSLASPRLFIALLTIFQPALQNSVEAGIIAKDAQEFSRTRWAAFIGVPAKEQESATLDQSSVHSDVTPTPTPCPDGQAFCESADDHPRDHVKDIQKKDTKNDHLHNEEVEVTSEKPDNAFRVCPTETKIVYPKKALSKEGSVFFVVNNAEKRQGVKVETCKSTGECIIPGNLANGYTSRCVQTYKTHVLVVLNQSSDDGFSPKFFEFPSGCSCEISYTGHSFGITPVNTTAAPTPS